MALPVIRRSVFRLGTAVSLGVGVGLLLSLRAGWAVSVLAGWDAGGIVLAVLTWGIILRSDAAATRARAGAEDPGRVVVWVLVSFGSLVGLLASSVMMHRAHGIAPREEDALVSLCLLSVFLAWLLTHTCFALRYARLYYREEPGTGGEDNDGIQFPGGEPPDDLDFAYFAFTIGICFQVSDTTVTSRVIRRTVLFHSMLAFGYSTIILALTLNVFFSVLS